MRHLILALAAALVLIASPMPAVALTIDFTDNQLFGSTDLSQTYTPFDGASLTVNLAPADGSLTFTGFDGDSSVAALAFDY